MRGWVLLAGLAACAPTKPDGSCLHWSDCGEGGACEYSATHPEFPASVDGGARFECSVADDACESGRAFGEFASVDRRGTCLDFSPGFDGRCDGTHTCDVGLYCGLGRCLSVRQLDATADLVAAWCANDGRTGADVWLWGVAFPLFGEMLFSPGVLADAAPFLPPPDPPPAMDRHFETKSTSVGEVHLCISGLTENGVKQSECFGDSGNLAVAGGVVAFGDWGFLTPSSVGVANYSLIAAGKTHTCGSPGRGITCWGENDRKQLDGTGLATHIADVGLDGGILTHLTAGAFASCAATTGTVTTPDVWCWGDPSQWAAETFADPTLAGTPQIVLGLSQGEVTALDAGETHVCAVKGGLLWCWGGNEAGQTTGEATNFPELPTRPLGDTPVIAVAAGRQHTCAVTAANQVMCWGGNVQGQLGSPTSSTKPIVVPLEARAVGTQLLAAGDDHTCALLEDSWVHCWGAPALTTDTGVLGPDGSPVVLDRIPLTCQ
jgi:Regulator of chromosome condensation (RCC1) repeat